MSNSPVARALFFGMHSRFSPPVLAALLNSNMQIAAIVEPASQLAASSGPVIQPKALPKWSHRPLAMADTLPSLEDLAREHELPIWEVRRLSDPAVIEQLDAYQPDLICVACFSLRIPPAVLTLPRLGCLNVHPALLPAQRGPVPLFWSFRNGAASTGVTIHLMDEGMDSGPILVQERLSIPDGISYTQLELRCATLGGQLLVQSVTELVKGTARPIPQDEAQSSYEPFPSEQDVIVQPETWSARHVYNFIRGVGRWYLPVELRLQDGSTIYARDATAYFSEQEMNIAALHENEGKQVRCKDGWVLVATSSRI